MKIYTKTGDKGKTSLLGGKRISKNNVRIEAYGTIDELNSHIGLLKDQNIDLYSKEILIGVQNQLFTIGSILATDPEGRFAKPKIEKNNRGINIPELKETDVFLFENEIDLMNKLLPEMKWFVLPGGHPFVSQCHIARCVCRRAERRVIALSEESFVPEIIIKYLNRLSDYLFVLSRKISMDLKIKEVPWRPGERKM